MFEHASRVLLLGAYQLSIALGILLLPVALVAGRVGISLPIHRLVRTLGAVYERRSPTV